MSAADKPGGGYVRKIGAPDARPHRIAERGGGDSGLGDICPCGRALIGPGFLLKMTQGELECDHRIQLGSSVLVAVVGQARLYGDE